MVGNYDNSMQRGEMVSTVKYWLAKKGNDLLRREMIIGYLHMCNKNCIKVFIKITYTVIYLVSFNHIRK